MLSSRTRENEPTFASLLTPPGRGAVATVAVWGAGALPNVSQCFQPVAGRPLESFPLGRIVFGRWGAAPGEELVVCRLGEQEFEVHCHGGAAAAENVMQTLLELGAQRLPWTQWQAGQAPNLLAAEAWQALAAARTERTAALLLAQSRGALQASLEHLLALLAGNASKEAAEHLQKLLAWAPLGLHLTTPWRVVLAGKPNVGKSSLLNALLGYERSLVFDYPGTTRDVLTATTALDGWPVEFADTAGLGNSDDELATAATARATVELQRADLVLHVFDVTLPYSAVELPTNTRALVVLNKIDLCRPGEPAPKWGLCVSARTGAGIPALLAALVAQWVPEAPAAEAAIPFLARHVACLEAAERELQRGQLGAAAKSVRELLSGC